MKGTITNCLASLIEERFGAERWKAILGDAGIDARTASVLRLPTSDVDDRVLTALLDSTCRNLGISLDEAADAFGKYWCCSYAPRLYHRIVDRLGSAREMILAMDGIHVQVTSMLANARPPRFDCHWVDEDTLDVTYKSKRKLLPIYIGLARGVGRYFGERLSVRRLGPDRVRIEFEGKPA